MQHGGDGEHGPGCRMKEQLIEFGLVVEGERGMLIFVENWWQFCGNLRSGIRSGSIL